MIGHESLTVSPASCKGQRKGLSGCGEEGVSKFQSPKPGDDRQRLDVQQTLEFTREFSIFFEAGI